MTSPICLAGVGSPASTLNGVNVAGGATVTIALANTAGVRTWSIACIGVDELQSATTITSSLTIDPIGKTATFTAPTTLTGAALIFRSVVNVGLVDEASCTFGIYILSSYTGCRVGAWNEIYEGDPAFGWTSKFNALARGNLAGGFTSLSASGTVTFTGNVSLGGGGSHVGFYGATPVVQASRVGQLTDSTGGAVSSTLAAGITDGVAKNAIASLAAKVNALELVVHGLGLTA